MVALTLLLAAGCGSDSGPVMAVKQFYRSVECGRFDESARLLSTDVLAGSTADEINDLLLAGRQDIHRNGGIRSISVEAEHAEGDSAGVFVTVRYRQKDSRGNRHWQGHAVALVREEGAWKIALPRHARLN